MNDLKYLNTCACVDAMDRIASKVFIRLSYEYGICFLKRELIPSMASWSLKCLISNIGKNLKRRNLVMLNFDIFGGGAISG